MKKWSVILFFMLFTLTSYAQSNLTKTYIGESITFQYPEDWQLTVDNPNHIILSTETLQVDIFASALTPDTLKLPELISNLLQGSGAPIPANPPVVGADGSVQEQAVLPDGKILYLKGYAEEDQGVVFVRANLTSEGDIATIEAILATLQPSTFGSRYYESKNDQIVFRQPIGFTVSNPSDGFIVLSNTIDLLPPPMGNLPMLSGTLQIFVFSDLRQLPNYAPQAGDTTQEILFAYINTSSCPQPTCTLSQYLPISSVPNVTGSELNVKFPATDNLSLAVDTLDAPPLVFSAYSAPNEMSQWLDTISTVVTSSQRKPIVIPQVADTMTTLDTFAVAHPTGWVIENNSTAGVYTLLSNANINRDINNLQGDEAILFVIPNVATLKTASSYSAELTPQTVPSTIISYFASIATLNSGSQKNEMEIGQLDGRDYAGVVILPNEGNFEQQIYVISNGSGDFITILAYIRIGWLDQWQPILRDILAKTGKTQ